MQTEIQAEQWRARRRHETLERHYAHAVEAVCASGFGSTRLLQDCLGIGYHRASLLIEALQENGILGEVDCGEFAVWAGRGARVLLILLQPKPP
jgi:DNA segregation ATPase FtsK/SpoIIIE-like protein